MSQVFCSEQPVFQTSEFGVIPFDRSWCYVLLRTKILGLSVQLVSQELNPGDQDALTLETVEQIVYFDASALCVAR